MWFEDEFLERYPCIAAHLMCERDIYQLSPAEAALIIRDAKYRFRCEHEWVAWKYDGDARSVIPQTIRKRHCHKKKNYKAAKALIELAIEEAL